MSSSASTTAETIGHPDYVPPPLIVFEEKQHATTMKDPDTAQLHDEIAALKQQLMGLVQEHMEERELRKEQKQNQHNVLFCMLPNQI